MVPRANFLTGTNSTVGRFVSKIAQFLREFVRSADLASRHGEGASQRTAMSQWVKLAEEQGEIVRKIKEDMKADPASHTKEELDAAVAKLKELKAKADDPMNALEDPVTKVSAPETPHADRAPWHTAPASLHPGVQGGRRAGVGGLVRPGGRGVAAGLTFSAPHARAHRAARVPVRACPGQV